MQPSFWIIPVICLLGLAPLTDARAQGYAGLIAPAPGDSKSGSSSSVAPSRAPSASAPFVAAPAAPVQAAPSFVSPAPSAVAGKKAARGDAAPVANAGGGYSGLIAPVPGAATGTRANPKSIMKGPGYSGLVAGDKPLNAVNTDIPLAARNSTKLIEMARQQFGNAAPSREISFSKAASSDFYSNKNMQRVVAYYKTGKGKSAHPLPAGTANLLKQSLTDANGRTQVEDTYGDRVNDALHILDNKNMDPAVRRKALQASYKSLSEDADAIQLNRKMTPAKFAILGLPDADLQKQQQGENNALAMIQDALNKLKSAQ